MGSGTAFSTSGRAPSAPKLPCPSTEALMRQGRRAVEPRAAFLAAPVGMQALET